MTTSDHSDSDLPPWLQSLLRWAWTRREQLALPVGGLLVVSAIGFALYLRFAPSDLQLAEADLKRAGVALHQLEADAHRSQKEANEATEWVAHYRKEIDDNSNRNDHEWIKWKESYCQANAERHALNIRRRNALLTLATEYIPLLVEAEREILLARTARDRGHPIQVAPRVREILAPLLLTP